MPCFHPREIIIRKPKVIYQWIPNPDGTMTRIVDNKTASVAGKQAILVPCGKCAACRAQAQSQWSFRIENEALYGGHASCLFVTFTYAPEFLPKDKCLSKIEVQRYLHDLRQNLYRRYSGGTDSEIVPKVKYYFCGEYGSMYGRPHYHAILFFSRSVDWTIIQKSWGKGIVDIREFTPARAGYVAKYSLKDLEEDYNGRTPPFHLQSKGLGQCFLNKYNSFRSLSFNTYFSNLSGHKVKLPRYYLDKLGTTRKFKSKVLKDGTIKRTSTTSHSYAYEMTNQMAYYRYLQKESLDMCSFSSYSDYLLSKRSEVDTLEFNLNKLKHKSKSYYVKTKIELRNGQGLHD